MKALLIALFWFFGPINENEPKIVRATVYHAVENQCNEDPKHTAFMFELDLTNPYKHRIIAVSRDLLAEYPKGTKVTVKGTKGYDGVYTVMDKMGKTKKNREEATKDIQPRIKIRNSIDILINVDMQIGAWDNVTITKI